jgi:hypothetical protein
MRVVEDAASPDRRGRARPIGLRPPWDFNRADDAEHDLATIGGEQSGSGADQ